MRNFYILDPDKKSSQEDFIRSQKHMEGLEKEIEKLKERNRRVEADKARETSITRRILIMILTYAVIVTFFSAAELPKPRINAIVPTIGFIVSTLGLGIFKKLRIKHRRQ